MKPGRELDALIAEKVMGWKPLNSGTGYDTPAGLRGLPEYSTDIAAAWEVVEKIPFVMREGWSEEPVRMNFFLRVNDNGTYTAGYEWRYWAIEFDVEAPTAPLAICLAALKVIDEKLKDDVL